MTVIEIAVGELIISCSIGFVIGYWSNIFRYIAIIGIIEVGLIIKMLSLKESFPQIALVGFIFNAAATFGYIVGLIARVYIRKG